MIYKDQLKQKQVDPDRHNMLIVEDNLTEVKILQFVLAMIMDEELLGETNRPTDEARIR
jgi:hypothetical protein